MKEKKNKADLEGRVTGDMTSIGKDGYLEILNYLLMLYHVVYETCEIPEDTREEFKRLEEKHKSEY